ncbi:alpha/beta hydrolase [Alteromonas aestuariivivens]|uniref:Alpha/beta hydrolase n=1 Tax=Alteromonas aestuariivivens TaxID=1938339 RepID=A0A3D8M7J6_9ALTE|nr:alpha/beta hydrolase [Alteromonas aestuariivivens]RDV25569.1 alpha/beta hydrolase [Alteromonas aestuariivivens]
MIEQPVVFLPGTLCDERVWLPVWRQLSLAQRRYVPLQWASSKEEMLTLTADRIMNDEKVHLVGFSMGGYIASLYACANPKRIASLTLVGYNANGFEHAEEMRRKQLIGSLRKGQFKPDNPNYLERFIHLDFLNSQVADTVRAMGSDLGASTLLAHTQATTPRSSTLAGLAKSPFPIHVVAAEQDQVTPLAGMQSMAATLPSATLTVILGSGHMVILERPAETTQALLAGFKPYPPCK